MRLFPVVVRKTTTTAPPTPGGGGLIAGRPVWGVRMIQKLTARVVILPGVAMVQRYTLRSQQGTGVNARQAATSGRINQGAGVRTIQVLTSRSNQREGVALRQAATTVRVPQRSGVALVGRYAGTVRPTQSTGVREVARISNGRGVVQRSAAEIVRIQTDLTHRRGGSTVVTSTGWGSPALAIDGTNGRANGTVAGANGTTLASTAPLVLSYPVQTNRSALAVTAVTLHFYVGTSAVVTGATLTLHYSLDSGANFTQLGGALPGSLNSTIPLVFDITTAVAGDWAKIAALRTKVLADFGAASNAAGISADAVEVEVVASNTLLT